MTDRFRKAHRPLNKTARAHLDALKDHAAAPALTNLEQAVMWATKALLAAPAEPDPTLLDPDLAKIVE